MVRWASYTAADAVPASPRMERQPGGTGRAAPPVRSATIRQPFGAGPGWSQPKPEDEEPPQPVAAIASATAATRKALQIAIPVARPTVVVAVGIAAVVLGDAVRAARGASTAGAARGR